MKKVVFWICLMLSTIALSLACVPVTAPATPTAPAPAQVITTIAPISNLPPVRQAQGEPPTAQDAAWSKVVEAARKEGVITIYAGSQFAGDAGRKALEAFTNQYGIRVDVLIIAGRQAVEKVKIENKMKLPIADILGVGLSSQTELSLAGLLDSIWQDLPELRNTAVFRVDQKYTPNGDVLNMTLEVTGPIINTRLVKAQDEPRSYADLLDPKWKGKIILIDPRSGGGGGFAWFAEMRYYKILDDDYFRRLARQEPSLWGGSEIELANMIGRGEAWLYPYTSAGIVGPMILEGAPIKILGMNEGNSVLTNPISTIKGSSHPNASKVFINWLFSKEGQDIYGKAFKAFDPMRKDVTNYVDPRLRPQPEPQKLLARTYEVAEASNRYHKEGIAEGIFGKR